jgi:ATP-dependent helicase/nuclease subunit B
MSAGASVATPTVYTIAAGAPFVDVLAAGIVERVGDDPSDLAAATVLLPTRRACRALAEAFLRLSDGRPMLLPRLMPLGDLDEDAVALGDDEVAASGLLDLPPAIPALRRQLLLSRLVLALDPQYTSPDQAVHLAAELGRLLDQVQTERLGFEGLAGLAPERFADHWQVTLDFLTILTDRWPAILAAEGCMDRADHRNRLLAGLAETWQREPPADPVFAAGSTGSIPATADLLSVIARLPQGCVVLPGLDRGADDETWRALAPAHPQFGLARLIDHIGIDRDAVADWHQAPPASSRAGLLSRALRPADAGPPPVEPPAPAEATLAGLQRIDCPGPQEEAGVIALVLRQALETPAQTAALITPDRGLARRVAAELRRWDIDIDDSAGQPLLQTPPGAFLRLTARMVGEDLAPLPLLATLKHPLASGGMATVAYRDLVRRLERAVLRGPRPAPGIGGLRAALPDEAGADLRAMVERLGDAVRPMADLLADRQAPVPALVRAHIALAETLAADQSGDGAARLWAGDAGEAAAAFIADLDEAADILEPLAGASYAALFDALAAGRAVRPTYGRHPRLNIWGLLEARLQHADVLVLGGLNEGTWPPEAPSNPWMSRPMMEAFGLPLPERRIGLTAHDFAQAFAAPRVVMTRARRVEGTPTVPSRWLLRLDNLIKGEGTAPAADEDRAPWLHWQKGLDEPTTFTPARPPAPTPPVSARPRQLSVTQVETWMRDPYAVYARHVLDLRALEAIDADPDAADYGTFIHDALDEFVAAFPAALPDDAVDRLLAIGRGRLGDRLQRPGIAAFWWPRFERIAAWFIDTERTRRRSLSATASEVKGYLVIDGPEGAFTLTAKADRIDTLADGSLAVVDYKTGTPPSRSEVAAGFAPQLPLEAAIAEAGGFAGVAGGRVSDLEYWRLRGGNPVAERSSAGGGRSGKPVSELVADAVAGLTGLIAAFDRPETPYEARPRPDAAPAYSDYEHLARVREWSAGGDGEGDG